MPVVEETYDIVVVGAGHAGCEAALAAARLGFETIMFTVSGTALPLMPCNPNVGGVPRDILSVSLMPSAVRWAKILIKRLSSRRC